VSRSVSVDLQREQRDHRANHEKNQRLGRRGFDLDRADGVDQENLLVQNWRTSTDAPIV
jgi:hypothetical protein